MAADGKYTRTDFDYDTERDLYTCPDGKELKTSGAVDKGTTIKYFGKEHRVSRDVIQKARDYTLTLMETDAYINSAIQRKKVERLFGEAKHLHVMVRLRLRGLRAAKDEFLLTATIQNLKRLANILSLLPPQTWIA